MAFKRREFMKMAGLTGLANFCLPFHNALFPDNPKIGVDSVYDLPGEIDRYQKFQKMRFNMSGYAAPKISTVRVGIIGTGNRGTSHAGTMARISDVEIVAAADLEIQHFERIGKILENTDHNPEYYYGSENEWMSLCDRKDVDVVLIATPTYMHAKMAVYAMEQGKHVLTEIPAAMTIEECWDIVKASEESKRHCMMMANSSYMPFHITMLNMAKQGFFGEIVHGDGAYNTSKIKNNFSKSTYWNMWWLRLYGSRQGNIYPVHALGTIAQMMNINRGDQLDFLVSMESKDFVMKKKAIELAKEDAFYEEFTKLNYRGNMNSILIRTKKGRTIHIQHDASTPSPHNLIQGVYGTEGAVLLDPSPPRISIGQHKWVDKDTYDKLEEKYKPELIHKFDEFKRELGSVKSGHDGADIIMMWHIIDCLRSGLPLDQDVYDAATFSSVVALSEWSVLNNSNSIKVPDFTLNAWKKNNMNMDINLLNGCGDTRLLN